jgi:hypothetical protein
MVQHIPVSVFLSHIGNNNAYPFTLKEHVQLSTLNKEFSNIALSDRMIAKAISNVWSPLGLEISELVLNSDFSLESVHELSLLMIAKKENNYEKLLFGFPTLSVDNVFKREKQNLKNTTKIIELLFLHFQDLDDDTKTVNIPVSKLCCATIIKWLQVYVQSVIGPTYPRTIQFLGSLVLDIKRAKRLMNHCDSYTNIHELIKVFQCIEDESIEQLQPTIFPDNETFQNAGHFWTQVGGDYLVTHNPIENAVLYYLISLFAEHMIQLMKNQPESIELPYFCIVSIHLCNAILSDTDDTLPYLKELKMISTKCKEQFALIKSFRH